MMKVYSNNQKNKSKQGSEIDKAIDCQDDDDSTDTVLKKRPEPSPHKRDSLSTIQLLEQESHNYKKLVSSHSTKNKRIFESLKLSFSEESQHLKPQVVSSDRQRRTEGGQQLLDSLSGKVDGLLEVVFKHSSNINGSGEEYSRQDSLSLSIRQERIIQTPCPTPKKELLKENSSLQMKFDNSIINKKNYSIHVHAGEQVGNGEAGWGFVKGYAACSDEGLFRNYNEDRISVLVSIPKPPEVLDQDWQPCSFFGVYDGHGGSTCPDFLKDNLHNYVINNEFFPSKPAKALEVGFEKAELDFCAKAMSNPSKIDISGSCAVVALIVGDTIYLANLGDSRVISSHSSGSKTRALTKDMKPSVDSEQLRITKAGGRLYQTISQLTENQSKIQSTVYGPMRVLPGRLSVCRSFGDIESKEPSLGGKPGVIIAVPEITSLKITEDLDFLIMASDGVFDKLENDEVNDFCWRGLKKAAKREDTSLEEVLYFGAEEVMARSLAKKTQDNISVLIVCFKTLRRLQAIFIMQQSQKLLHERLSNVLKKSMPTHKPHHEEFYSQRLS
jgi:serine/threonine protein phosphatase PrpC